MDWQAGDKWGDLCLHWLLALRKERAKLGQSCSTGRGMSQESHREPSDVPLDLLKRNEMLLLWGWLKSESLARKVAAHRNDASPVSSIAVQIVQVKPWHTQLNWIRESKGREKSKWIPNYHKEMLLQMLLKVVAGMKKCTQGNMCLQDCCYLHC